MRKNKHYSDLPPDEKSEEELELMILRDAAGIAPGCLVKNTPGITIKSIC